MNQDFLRLRSLLAPRYGAGEASAIAFLVVDDVFGLSRTDVYMDKTAECDEAARDRFEAVCAALEGGTPVQYALGWAEFCGRRFVVTDDVLIPRPETEELVAWVVDECRKRDSAPRVLDCGTGSGCIAASVKLEIPSAQVEAWDVSDGALCVARGNAQRLGADVRFANRDMLQPWGDAAYDIIVSNPPYICDSERADMEQHVLDHEPSLALFVPDADPLRFYRALARGAVRTLSPDGCLLVEVNRAYAHETAALFAAEGLTRTEVRCDAFGNERMVGAWR